MYIRRLTIASLMKGYQNIVIDCPSIDSAITLINQRLKCNRVMPGDSRVNAKYLPKLPKSLKDLVNPATRVVGNNHTFSTMV